LAKDLLRPRIKKGSIRDKAWSAGKKNIGRRYEKENTSRKENALKKLFGLCAIALFLSSPFAANADPYLGTGWMDLYYSPPVGGGYYLDYDGKVTSSTFGYTTGLEEVFCVSPDHLNSQEFVTFYAITPELGADKFKQLSAAAWIADNWKDTAKWAAWGATGLSIDDIKGEAQKAVWKITGVMDIVGGDGTDSFIYADALKHYGYMTTNWYFADSAVYQDYLTPARAVPEPSVLLIMGSGFAAWGAMNWRRRKS
jgi:hypothetical protein